MTTFAFTPSQTAAFTFQPVLDGSTYNVVVTWNIFGQRYYVNCYDLSGNLIFALPLISSPVGTPISITKGYFNSTMVYYGSTQTIEVLP
jgi:hypothetical protein